MKIHRIAAFSHNSEGGNPAGVVLLDKPLSEADMMEIAHDVGYSETVFAVRKQNDSSWRARYFSPESEVPFCGHATIALGAVLGREIGAGMYNLSLNSAEIEVSATTLNGNAVATLSSPPTKSRPISVDDLNKVLALFELTSDDLDERLPPGRIHGGSDHIVIALKSREVLAQMHYDLLQGKALMRELGVVTIMLVHIENTVLFNVRNAFASGGVLEDPATGAAAAAFAGYLRDRGWPHDGAFAIEQGADMGHPSAIHVRLSDVPGSAVTISGATRVIDYKK